MKTLFIAILLLFSISGYCQHYVGWKYYDFKKDIHYRYEYLEYQDENTSKKDNSHNVEYFNRKNNIYVVYSFDIDTWICSSQMNIYFDYYKRITNS